MTSSVPAADKKKKKTMAKMSLGEFLLDDKTGSWADDLSLLPSAPAAAFAPSARTRDGSPERERAFERSSSSSVNRRDPVPIPDNPPFVAYIGNLPFTVDEDLVKEFFSPEKITHVKLVRDPSTQRLKGFGYVEFVDRDALVEALERSNESFMERPIKIDVADQSNRTNSSSSQGRGGAGARQGAFGGMASRASAAEGSWRSAKKEGESSVFSSSSRNSSRTTEGGGFSARSNSSVFGGGRSNREEDSPRPARRPLQLQPRTKPIEPSVPSTTSPVEKPKRDPFGGARPREEVLKEKSHDNDE